MRTRWTALVTVIGLSIATAGCSAAVALTQYAERSAHHTIHVGSALEDVERALGEPVSQEVSDDGSLRAIYRETITNHSPFWSTPPWIRATLYVFYDIATLGFLELVATPMEVGGKIYRAVNATEYDISVVYDSDRRVVDYSRQARAQ